MRCLLPLLLALTACNYSHVKVQPSSGGLPQGKRENPDYATVAQALVGPRCVGCHSNAGGNKGSTNLETYANVRAKMNRVYYRSLETKDMPPGGLNAGEADLLKTWIKNGMPEFVAGLGEKPAEDIENGANNWKKIKERIFAKKCVDCHQLPDPKANLDLTDLKVARANILNILGSVFGKGDGTGGDMPLAPYPAVTPAEREVLLKWFNLGMPE